MNDWTKLAKPAVYRPEVGSVRIVDPDGVVLVDTAAGKIQQLAQMADAGLLDTAGVPTNLPASMDEALKFAHKAPKRPATPFSGVTLPVPPSVNHYWATRRGGGKYLTPRALAFRRAVALVMGGMKPTDKPLVVEWWCFRPQDRGDIDNFNKALLDALKGFVYLDDKLVVDLICHNRLDRKNPRLELDWRLAE